MDGDGRVKKCQLCKTHEATVHFKQVVEGEVRELNCCQACAAKNGFDVQSPMALTDFLFGLGMQDGGSDDEEDLACPRCGLRQAAFLKASRLGCARCYETFAEDLAAMLQDMHRSVRHEGKVPARERASAEGAAIQKAMERAIAKEDFEEAATLRDRLRELRVRTGPAAGAVDAPVEGGAP
jgi:protein arginine kinase activator